MEGDPRHIRFWAKVSKPAGSECWLWTGAKDRDGYGTFKFAGAMAQAHRVSWLISGNELSGDEIVCHSCDTPGCVRPDHLFAGTHVLNAVDRQAKRRRKSMAGKPPRTLPESTRQEIREFLLRGEPVRKIARHFGVTPAAVRYIRRRSLDTALIPTSCIK